MERRGREVKWWRKMGARKRQEKWTRVVKGSEVEWRGGEEARE